MVAMCLGLDNPGLQIVAVVSAYIFRMLDR